MRRRTRKPRRPLMSVRTNGVETRARVEHSDSASSCGTAPPAPCQSCSGRLARCGEGQRHPSSDSSPSSLHRPPCPHQAACWRLASRSRSTAVRSKKLQTRKCAFARLRTGRPQPASLSLSLSLPIRAAPPVRCRVVGPVPLDDDQGVASRVADVYTTAYSPKRLGESARGICYAAITVRCQIRR